MDTASSTTEQEGMLASLQERLRAIRDALVNPREDSGVFLRGLLTKQRSDHSVLETMHVLTPILFANLDDSSDEKRLTSKDAMLVLQCLVTDSPDVYLKEASRSIKEYVTTANGTALTVPPEMVAVMIQQLTTTSDVEVSQNAAESIQLCCQKIDDLIFTTSVVEGMTSTWQDALSRLSTDRVQASVTAVRCASVIIKIAGQSDAAATVAAEDALHLLMKMLNDGRDTLMQMSVLDLLEQLINHRPLPPPGAQWLLRSAAPPVLRLAGGDEEKENEGPDPLLGGVALRVVAGLCKLGQHLHQIDDSERLTRSFHRALHNFELSGELGRLALIDAISSFAASSGKALHLVLDDPVTRDAWLSLKVAQPKLKAAILGSVAFVLDPTPEVDVAGDTIPVTPLTNELGMKLFSHLGIVNGPEATEIVLSLTKSPLPEARLAAYRVIQAVAKLPTGGQLLFIHGDFYNFLTSRQGESTKEGREAKYAIAQTVLASEAKGLLAEEIIRSLEKYIAQGPNHVDSLSWEVAEQ